MEGYSTSSNSDSHHAVTTHPRACTICARAKAKCVPGDGRNCQRCQRLKRVCEPVRAQPRSQPRKRTATSASRVQKSQVEKLEAKLDSLVTLLKSTQDSRSSNESPVPATFDPSPAPLKPIVNFNAAPRSCHEGAPGEGWIHLEIPNGNGNSHPSQTPEGLVTPITTTTSLWNLGLQIPESIDFTSEQANILLNRFRDQISPFFPFIVIPPSLSAQDLHRDRPFLLKSILAVASRVPSEQLALGKWLVRQLADRIAVNGERNLDLLLGVLTYTGCLGMVLVYDLGLNRPPPSDQSSRSLFEIALRETTNPGFPIYGMHTKTSRSLEDRRALLGMFFISSAASNYFRSKIDPLKITPYIYDCLETLDKAQDHPDDICATSLVRLQLIVERINQSPWNTNYGVPENFGSGPPPMLYVKSLQEQLKNFRSAMPPEVKIRGYMLMHYYHVEEALYEIGLSKSPVMGNLSGHDFQRLELLYACLQSNKMFFETFFAIPENKYVSFSLATWTQLTHSIFVLQLLSNFDHPDWNLAYVRETIDFMAVLDSMIERFNKVEGRIFAHTATKMASIKAHIQEKMAVDGVGPRPGSLSGEDADMGRTWEPVDFLDETWLRDVLGPIEF